MEKLGSSIVQQVGLAWGAKDNLKRLKETLSALNALLLDAEEQLHKNNQLTHWLKKLKDVSYDAEDILDALEYEALRSQALSRDGIRKKVCNALSSLKIPFSRWDMGRMIKEIRERLDDIAKDRDRFQFSERHIDGSFSYGKSERTHSFVNASDVIGRDQDKEKIIDFLMHSDHEDRGFPSFQ